MLKEPDAPQDHPKNLFTRHGVTVAVLIIMVWGAIRACSNDGITSYKPYRIAQERLTNSINVKGKEKNVEAFATDLINTIAKRKGISIQLYSVNPGVAFIGLEDKQYDAITTTIVPTAGSLAAYDFSDPIYRVGAVLIVPKDSTIVDFQGVEGKVVGITRDESTFFQVGTYPEVLFYSYDDEIDALEDVESGRLDGVIMNAWPAYSLISGFFKGKLRVATKPFTGQGLRLASMKDSRFSRIMGDFDAGIKELRADGTYQELITKWGLIDTEQEGIEVDPPLPTNGEASDQGHPVAHRRPVRSLLRAPSGE